MVAGDSVEWLTGCSGKIPFFDENIARDVVRKWNGAKQPKIYGCDKGSYNQHHWHISAAGKTWKKKGK